VRLGVKPEINAISTILIAVVAVAVVAASLIGKGGAQRRLRPANRPGP
jgi:putrescine transport system permease protein